MGDQLGVARQKIQDGLASHMYSPLRDAGYLKLTSADPLTIDRVTGNSMCRQCCLASPMLAAALQKSLKDNGLWPLPKDQSIAASLAKFAKLNDQKVFGVFGADVRKVITPKD